MATSNNDRISSARLLDTIKGLQESRHLGSEPEVETETVEYPTVVSPAVGTYNNEEELLAGYATPDENRLPFKFYVNQIDPTNYPINITEPSGEYVELTQHNTVTNSGITLDLYLENTYDGVNFSDYTGYGLWNRGLWIPVHITNGQLNEGGVSYVWEMPAKTETTTTKTKRTIKQDYVPNADWNVNDPDADGYVQGRTHWVEIGTGEWVIDGNDFGSRTYSVDSFAKPMYWVSETNGFRYEPEYVAVKNNIEGLEAWVLAEDSNGNQITDFNTAMSTEGATMVVCADGRNIPDLNSAVITAIYRGQTTPVANDVIGYSGEIVHKLDRKFYDYTAPYIVPDYRDDNTLTNDLGLGFGVNEHVNCYGHINLHTHPHGTTKYFGFDDIVLENSHSYQIDESIYLGTKFIESLKNEYNDFKTVIGDTDFGYQLRRLLRNLYTRIVFSDQNLLFNNYPEELQKLMVRTAVYNRVYMPYKTSETEYEPLVALDYIYPQVDGVETKGVVPKLIIKENGSSRSVMYPSDTLYFFTIFNKRNKMIL